MKSSDIESVLLAIECPTTSKFVRGALEENGWRGTDVSDLSGGLVVLISFGWRLRIWFLTRLCLSGCFA